MTTPLPHRYAVSARAAGSGSVTLSAPGLPELSSAPPAEYGGPGDQWSPESLLMAAVADCFVLSFRAIAAASKLAFTRLECDAEGVLDRIERSTRFTEIHLSARLVVPVGSDPEKARRLLEKAEQNCFITGSLVAEVKLDCEVTTS